MTIKVISLNIWSGGRLLPAVLDFLRAEQADVLLLQEVYNGQDPALAEQYRSMQILDEQLTYPEARFGQAYLEKRDGRLIPHGNAVFSKLPIVSNSLVLLTESTRDFYEDIPAHWPILPTPLQHVEVQLDNRRVDFYNLHGVWDLDGDRDSPERQRMSRGLLAEAAGKPYVVVAGDSNAKPTNPALRRLEPQLKPVFGNELKTTFNMRHKTDPGYATAAVDTMYISPNVGIVSRACPDVDVSDHLPLVVRLQID